MITLRKAKDRGRSQLGWLDSHHTFSFSTYYDPEQMGFSELRVINDDYVIPGGGFPTHSHQDMEIITYVLSGKLEHKDSMGNTSIISPGDVQKMSAGKGITHSEFNASKENPVHFLQIWIQPNKLGVNPSYEQKYIPVEKKQGVLKLLASSDAAEDSISIHQDAKIYASVLRPAQQINYVISPTRKIYLHVATGSIMLNDISLGQGDGARVVDEKQITINGSDQAEILLFDLPCN
ncbi:Pirin [hydrothermal vent metagenome]|uniref:Pirin n=1 Tax=hydrothermal vent metagenome TaxID=652676 RepID=A0A3B0ZQM9_9ZZZZ